MWQNWTNAILGIAVFAVAFLGLEGATLTWALVILGAAIAIVGFTGVGVFSSQSTDVKQAN